MNVLVVDIGATHVKVLVTGQTEARKFLSGPTMAPGEMVDAVNKLTRDWKYDLISIGYPGLALHNHPIVEPPKLAPGWVGVRFEHVFGRTLKLINDAAMQALGSYEGRKMLFLGFGTRLGSAMVIDWVRRTYGAWASSR